MDRTPFSDSPEGAYVAWVPQQPGPRAGENRRVITEYEPISYPPLSEAPRWVLAQEIYAASAAKQQQRSRLHRDRLVAKVVAAAIILVGGGSIGVAVGHTSPNAAAQVHVSGR